MISVIIPYYNIDEKVFRHCIESVESQTFDDYEVVIVNDGSEKKYEEVLEKNCAAYNNILIIHQANRGVSVARNVGISNSRGEYVVFVDPDDYVSPFLLEELYNALMNGKYVAASSYIKPVYDDYYSFKKSLCKNKVINRKNFLINILKGFNCKQCDYGYISGVPCSIIIKKECIEKFEYPIDIKYMEDVIWGIQVFDQIEKVAFVPRTLYAYRQNEGSATHYWYLSVISDRIRALEKIKEVLPDDQELIEWYALRVMSSYAIICKCISLTNELDGFIERIKYFYKINSYGVWDVIRINGIGKKWDKKYRIKRILMKIGFLPIAYYIICLLKKNRL